MKALAHDALGLYFSIPFCRGKCTYCNFASGVYPASEHAQYVERLIEDLARATNWAKSMQVQFPRTVDTIYFGGGTPVLLPPNLFTQIFASVRETFQLAKDVEISIECAPGQLPDSTLEALLAAGVNRISLGVQSFVDREAQLSGRFHTRAIVIEDLRRLRAAGIANLNIDLLAGLPDQTLASWHESLRVLIDTGVPHASVYMLEIDEDSRLGRELISGGTLCSAGLVPNDDTIAQMYEIAVETVAATGLTQYEISNFALPGMQSKHNLRYWQRRPYLGLGLDASSMFHSADPDDDSVLRTTTTANLQEYLASAANSPETAWLSPTQQLEEAWFLGLRRNAGVSLSALRTEFGAQAVEPAVAVVNRLADDGLLHTEKNTVRLTPRGRLISNDVFAEFLGLGPVPDRVKHPAMAD